MNVQNWKTVSQIVFLTLFAWLMYTGDVSKWLVLFLLSVPLALALGRVFCGWICPMNTLMSVADDWAKKLNSRIEGVPKMLRSGNGGWYMLVVSIGLMVVARQMGFRLRIVLYLLVLSFLLTLRYEPRVWHRYLCPFGVLQSLPGRISWLGQRLDADRCTGCGACERVCPAEAVKVTDKANFDSNHCLQCFDCQQECAFDAISYTTRKADQTQKTKS